MIEVCRQDWYNVNMKKGFTLIELLVAIAVIGVIVALSYAAMGGARRQAQALKAGNDITNLVGTLAMALKKEGRNTWWTEDELGRGANPVAQEILGLSKVLKSAIPGTDDYLYDNDDDILGDNEADEKGVNIILVFPNDSRRDQYFELMDKTLDQKSGAARGRVRKAPGSMLIFNISPDPARLGF